MRLVIEVVVTCVKCGRRLALRHWHGDPLKGWSYTRKEGWVCPRKHKEKGGK